MMFSGQTLLRMEFPGENGLEGLEITLSFPCPSMRAGEIFRYEPKELSFSTQGRPRSALTKTQKLELETWEDSRGLWVVSRQEWLLRDKEWFQVLVLVPHPDDDIEQRG